MAADRVMVARASAEVGAVARGNMGDIAVGEVGAAESVATVDRSAAAHAATEFAAAVAGTVAFLAEDATESMGSATGGWDVVMMSRRKSRDVTGGGVECELKGKLVSSRKTCREMMIRREVISKYQ